MRLLQFTNALEALESMEIRDLNGIRIPSHFHVTEVGKTTRESIDCGGNPHSVSKATVQLYTAQDVDHRLSPRKIAAILKRTGRQLGLEDEEVEVEYQIDRDTVGLYGLELIEGVFYLTARHTDCLAKETCGIPEPATETVSTSSDCCTPGAGCC